MKDFISEVNAKPIPRELFAELVTLAIEARSGKRRTIPPDAERCLEDLPPGYLVLSDNPTNQMGMTIVAECRERFPSDEATQMSQSFLFRWYAIVKARGDGLLKDFIRSTGDGQEEINEAVFHAAAECPLNEDGEFDERYVARIRVINVELGDD